MKAIYKYRAENGLVVLPSEAIVLRQDHVDDGFYLGDFVWAIVDTDAPVDTMMPYHKDKTIDQFRKDQFNRVLLPVKEKQIITCGKPVYAGETDGLINIYCAGDVRPRKIVVYKTGQKITEDIASLRYIGLNRLWIIQELGLYTFEVME
jgi:hypothetical protein